MKKLSVDFSEIKEFFDKLEKMPLKKDAEEKLKADAEPHR